MFILTEEIKKNIEKMQAKRKFMNSCMEEFLGFLADERYHSDYPSPTIYEDIGDQFFTLANQLKEFETEFKLLSNEIRLSKNKNLGKPEIEFKKED